MKKRPMETDEEIGERERERGGEGKYSMCIVWTPLPLLTWLFPPVGHLGVTETSGLIHDFVGAHLFSFSLHLWSFRTARNV